MFRSKDEIELNKLRQKCEKVRKTINQQLSKDCNFNDPKVRARMEKCHRSFIQLKNAIEIREYLIRSEKKLKKPETAQLVKQESFLSGILHAVRNAVFGF